MSAGVVIVGAGHAGIGAAVALRGQGYPAPVTVIGCEPDAPYQRPPLSKDFLLGIADEAALSLRSGSFYRSNDISLRLGRRVTAINRGNRRVVLADGDEVPYSDLVLATGSGARSLRVPGHDLVGVHNLRTLEDARRLRQRAETARHVVVIGGGFVGLELAAALSSRGAPVAVVDIADRVLARAVSALLSRYVAAVHRGRGVRLVLGVPVAEIFGRGGTVTGVRDGNGAVHDADLVVASVGAAPRTALAESAGLTVANGIVVDGRLRTSDPHVYAIGDCACLDGLRLESVQNAADQSAHVARVLAGREPAEYHALPLFWSDQNGLRLQMAGLVREGDDMRYLGDPADGRFSLLAFRDGRLVAVESVNRPADHMAARKILGAGEVVTPDDLTGGSLRDFLSDRRAVRKS